MDTIQSRGVETSSQCEESDQELLPEGVSWDSVVMGLPTSSVNSPQESSGVGGDEDEDEDGSDPWGELLEQFGEGEADGEEEGLVESSEEGRDQGGSINVKQSTPPPSLLPRLTFSQVQTLLSEATRYPRSFLESLPSIRISTLGPCTNPEDAVWQHLCLTKSGDRGRCRLYATFLQAALPRGYAAVQHRNRKWVTWTESGRRGGKVYTPASDSKSGQGKATTYRIVRHEPGWVFTLTGTPLARYYRSVLRAHEHVSGRLTEDYRWLLGIVPRLSLDMEAVRAHCEGPRDQDDVRAVQGCLRGTEGYVEPTGRLHYALTKVPRSMRPFLRLDGEELTAIDIRRAHPCFLFMHAAREWELPPREVEVLRANRYAFPKDEITKWINDPAGAHNHKTVERWFSVNAPTFLREFRVHRRQLGDAMYTLYSNLESQIMGQVIADLRAAGFESVIAGREHDGLRVLSRCADEVITLVSARLDVLGDGWLASRAKEAWDERREALAERAERERCHEQGRDHDDGNQRHERVTPYEGERLLAGSETPLHAGRLVG